MKKVLRVFIVAVLAIMFANVATAQEKKNFTIDKLSVEGRVDYDYIMRTVDKSGLDGKFFNFEMKGSFLQERMYCCTSGGTSPF